MTESELVLLRAVLDSYWQSCITNERGLSIGPGARKYWEAKAVEAHDLLNQLEAPDFLVKVNAVLNAATPVAAIVLHAVHKIDGDIVLETACETQETYNKLPQVVSCCGIVCGKTGWNSDRGYACYKSTAAIAHTILPRGSK